MPTGARLIVDLLERRGVELCFGLPGVHNLALWEALRDSPIRLVGVRHEQAAAYAADGYARATGRLGVALTTTGPGAANTLAGVGEAWAARSPVLVIATDIPSTPAAAGRLPRRAARDDRPGGDVRADRQGRPLARSAARRSPVPRPRRPLADAPPRRTGRSTSRCATDLLGGEVAPPPEHADARRATGGRRPARHRRRARRRRRAARRRRAPADLGGNRRPRRRGPLAALADRLAAPVLTTYGAAGVLPPSHPCLVGLPAHVAPGRRALGRGRRRARRRLGPRRRADAELRHAAAAGARGREPRRARTRRKNYRADVMVEGDAGRVLAALADRLDGERDPEGLARRLRAVRGGRLLGARRPRAPLPRRDALRPARRRRRGRRHVHPGLLARRVLHAAPGRGACRSRSAGGRSATRSRPRSAPRWQAPGRPSRWSATAASCSAAASWRPSRRSGSR